MSERKSRIQQAFPAIGRALFESEKPVVEAFNAKYAHLRVGSPEHTEAQRAINSIATAALDAAATGIGIVQVSVIDPSEVRADEDEYTSREQFEDAFFEHWLRDNVDDGYVRSNMFARWPHREDDYMARETQCAWIGWQLAQRNWE